MSCAKGRIIQGCIWLTASWAAVPFSYAESLPDPTRPYGFAAPVSNTSPDVATGPILQSITVGPDRRAAIISGQAVKVGDLYRGARVTRITETEVTLAQGRNIRVLKLFAGLEKRAHTVPLFHDTNDSLRIK